MKLHTIKLHALRNEELYQFQTDLLGLLKNSDPVKTGLGAALYGEFNRLRAAADTALQPARKSALTPILAEEDALRDQLYGAMRDLRPAIEQNLRDIFEKVNALSLTAPDAPAATANAKPPTINPPALPAPTLATATKPTPPAKPATPTPAEPGQATAKPKSLSPCRSKRMSPPPPTPKNPAPPTPSPPPPRAPLVRIRPFEI
ncbi:MAG: hypothetical protein LBK99_00205 [Opitutaceae bacterium]|jgi:hypothetical protein|nr:hypothetical protein [Opitutaceae bacterium]